MYHAHPQTDTRVLPPLAPVSNAMNMAIVPLFLKVKDDFQIRQLPKRPKLSFCKHTIFPFTYLFLVYSGIKSSYPSSHFLNCFQPDLNMHLDFNNTWWIHLPTPRVYTQAFRDLSGWRPPRPPQPLSCRPYSHQLGHLLGVQALPSQDCTKEEFRTTWEFKWSVNVGTGSPFCKHIPQVTQKPNPVTLSLGMVMDMWLPGPDCNLPEQGRILQSEPEENTSKGKNRGRLHCAKSSYFLFLKGWE